MTSYIRTYHLFKNSRDSILCGKIKPNLSTCQRSFARNQVYILRQNILNSQTLELKTVYVRDGNSVSRITSFTDNVWIVSSDFSESPKIASAQRLLRVISEYRHFPAKVRCQSVWRALVGEDCFSNREIDQAYCLSICLGQQNVGIRSVQ